MWIGLEEMYFDGTTVSVGPFT